MGAPNYWYFGSGGNNPCGAYYPEGGPLSHPKMERANDECEPFYGHATANTSNSSNSDDEDSTTRGKGICCDFFKRINSKLPWQNDVFYRMFDTIAAIGDRCPACFFHAYKQHLSKDNPNIGANVQVLGSNNQVLFNTTNDNKPCEMKGRPLGGSLDDGAYGFPKDTTTKYIEYWSACKLLISEGLPGNCTMHNSFGLIMDTTQNITHIGSPNGSCQSNCMQLGKEYFERTVGGKFLSYADYPPNNFDNKTAYDCERKYTDRQQNSGPTGPKLIWAGFAPNQWNPDPSTPADFTQNLPWGRKAKWTLGTDPVPGFNTPTTLFWDETLGNNPQFVTYRMDDNLAGDDYEGYLPNGANKSNSWGLLAGSSSPQENSHLWARRSVWRFGGPDPPTASTDDAFSCCEYVSFGCTDPSFGSYEPQAKLDCDGVPTTNRVDNDGNCFNINGDQVHCWENDGLQCSKCIDTTGSPDPTKSDFNPNYNEYFTSPNPQFGCTQQILDSCGSSGFLSQGAWSLMINTRPSSWFYGGGAAKLGLQQPGYGDAAFWDKDGRDVTGGSFGRPKCQCNNNGCTDPRADNFSSLNTKDCSGELLGDVKCCVITKFGCTDSTKTESPTNNYFCTIDIDDNGPDNAQFCMDSTGTPCEQNGVYNQNCTGPNGIRGAAGVPLSSNSGAYNNPEVNLIDDGSCDLEIISGCKDDGGFLAGGIWPAPIYPGYSAMNFNPNATLHIQTSCEYVFGCPDPLAVNASNPVCVTDQFTNGITQEVVTYYNTQFANSDKFDNYSIDDGFVQDNLIPNIECCDYQFVGGGAGCTDPNALNYNPLALTDNGSCIYNIEGCTDPTALNFNPAATSDDSSCIYEGQFPGEGTNFLDGTPIELCREPLTKEEVLMNVCQPTEIQSEVFIERGKQSVFETNQRLDEVKTIGGLKIYGYGFYNIKEQI